MTEKKELIEAIIDPKNWKPNLSAISEQTGIGLSSISQFIKLRQEKYEIEVEIHNNSEAEALILRKNEQALENDYESKN